MGIFNKNNQGNQVNDNPDRQGKEAPEAKEKVAGAEKTVAEAVAERKLDAGVKPANAHLLDWAKNREV